MEKEIRNSLSMDGEGSEGRERGDWRRERRYTRGDPSLSLTHKELTMPSDLPPDTEISNP